MRSPFVFVQSFLSLNKYDDYYVTFAGFSHVTFHLIMSLDWKKGPGYTDIKHISLPAFEVYKLTNGVEVYALNQGSQEIIKFDIVFRGGRLLEHKKLVSKFTASLLREGCPSMGSVELANFFDFHGAALRVASNLDFVYLSLSCLSKHFETLLPLLAELLLEPTFEQKELDKLKKSTSQKLIQDLSKNDLVSYRVFTEALFGKDHPYGYNSTHEDIAAIQKEDLIQYHKNAFGLGNAFMVLGGRFSESIITKIDQYLGAFASISPLPQYEVPINSLSLEPITVYTKNEFQASIKIGKRLFNRQDVDYPVFFFLNTLFGGYFGSRLMASIREKHGYTYNVFSVYDHLIYDGYFYIGTEVGLEYLEPTLKEIEKQIDLICSQKPKPSEMKMVKNYLVGNFLNLIDGPLNSASLIKSLVLDHTLDGHFERFIDQILTISAQDVLNCAQKYLDKETFMTTIVTYDQKQEVI